MLSTIDTHVGGEIFRIITQSPMQLTNQNDLDEEMLVENYEMERALLLNEPRGHRGVTGCLVRPSNQAEYAVTFINQQNSKLFHYSGLVATITTLLETGILLAKKDRQYKIETSSGIHTIYADFDVEKQVVDHVQVNSGICRSIDKSEAYHVIEVDQKRRYILYQLPLSIPRIHIEHVSEIRKWGKQHVTKWQNTENFTGAILMDGISANLVRSVTFDKDGAIVRSPGIDSTFAICTALSNVNTPFKKLINQSIFDSEFIAKGGETPEQFSITAKAYVTGEHQFIYDEDDPLEKGFLLK